MFSQMGKGIKTHVECIFPKFCKQKKNQNEKQKDADIIPGNYGGNLQCHIQRKQPSVSVKGWKGDPSTNVSTKMAGDSQMKVS